MSHWCFKRACFKYELQSMEWKLTYMTWHAAKGRDLNMKPLSMKHYITPWNDTGRKEITFLSPLYKVLTETTKNPRKSVSSPDPVATHIITGRAGFLTWNGGPSICSILCGRGQRRLSFSSVTTCGGFMASRPCALWAKVVTRKYGWLNNSEAVEGFNTN